MAAFADGGKRDVERAEVKRIVGSLPGHELDRGHITELLGAAGETQSESLR